MEVQLVLLRFEEQTLGVLPLGPLAQFCRFEEADKHENQYFVAGMQLRRDVDNIRGNSFDEGEPFFCIILERM